MLNSLGKAFTALTLNAFALGAVAWVAYDVWTSGILRGVAYQPAEVDAEPIDAGPDRVDVAAIARSHLFGTEPREPRVVETRVAPPTRLNLNLVGVIAIGTANEGIALIEAGRGRQQVVRVGQVIGKTDATLAEVRRDHVLIERNGELERLALKRPTLESQPIRSLDDGDAQSADAGLENLPMPSDGAEPETPPAQLASGEAALPEPAEVTEQAAEATGNDAPSPAGTRLTLPF